MRVLHFRSTSSFAGPERGLLTLGRALRALGIEAKIIAYYRQRPPEPSVHRMVAEGHQEQIDVEQWEDRSLFSWRTVARLAGELQRGAYDVLVPHDHKTDLMGYLAARRSRTPCLAAAHGYDLPLFRMILYRHVDLLVLRRFPRIVVVSDSLRQELIRAGLSAERIRVVWNGIDPARFSDGASSRAVEWRERFAASSVPVILTVARLYRQKGLEYFVQSAARIHEVVPQARFWIAGDGMLRGELAALIQRLGLLDTVTLLGGQDDIAGIMAASDVFVLPSLSESLGNVLLEAMALGKPVIATSVGGIPELVRDHETGWLVPPRQPAALAEAVLQVLRDPDGAARIATRGRDFVASRFAASHIASRMAEVYREVVSAAGAEGH